MKVINPNLNEAEECAKLGFTVNEQGESICPMCAEENGAACYSVCSNAELNAVKQKITRRFD